MDSKHQLLATVYERFNARDIDAVLAKMDPDVDWPNAMEGGRVYGHSGVRDYWQRQWKLVNPRVEPTGFMEDDAGRTVVDVHQVVRDMTGTILIDQMVQHVYTVHEGLIQRMDIGAAGPRSMSAADEK